MASCCSPPVIIAAAFFLVYRDARRGAVPLTTLGLTIWAAAASSVHWLTRPHVFSFLFMAIWLSLLDRPEAGRQNGPLAIAVCDVLWANFHGGFIFGFVACLAYAVSWLVQPPGADAQANIGTQLLRAGGLSFGASFLTPAQAVTGSPCLQFECLRIVARTAADAAGCTSRPAPLARSLAWSSSGLPDFAPGPWLLTSHVLLLVTTAVWRCDHAQHSPFLHRSGPDTGGWDGMVLSGLQLLAGSARISDRFKLGGLRVGDLGNYCSAAFLVATVAARARRYGFDPRRFLWRPRIG